MTETAQAALTAGRFPNSEKSWGLQHFGRQHLGIRRAPGPTLARSHSFTQRPGTTCRLIGTVLPAEEEAGFLPAHRVSNLGKQSTVLHASPEKLPTLMWKQGQANLYSSSQE